MAFTVAVVRSPPPWCRWKAKVLAITASIGFAAIAADIIDLTDALERGPLDVRGKAHAAVPPSDLA